MSEAVAAETKSAESAVERPVEIMAACQFYNPWVMGGSVWTTVLHPVPDPKLVDLHGGIKGFVYHSQELGNWRLHELTTGGLLGESAADERRSGLIARVNKLLAETPDIDKQIEQMKQDNKVVVTYAEAMRKLQNAERRKS